MSDSGLVTYTRLSPNCSSRDGNKIYIFTPHCVVGQVTVERLGEIFAPTKRRASSNYGIGKDGRVGMYVHENTRSWCSSSKWNDQRAITVECASDATEPYAFKEIVYERLVDLLVDCCKRNGKTKVLWFNDKNKSINYKPKDNEMLLTVHRWFDKNRSCPGTWMFSRMQRLADDANKRLGGQPQPTPTPTKDMYRVRKAWDDAKSQKGAFKNLDNAKKCCDDYPGYSVFDGAGKAVYTSSSPATEFKVEVKVKDLNIRKGPGTSYARVGTIAPGIYTIVETSNGKGSKTGWGKLKSGVGWISLDFVTRL